MPRCLRARRSSVAQQARSLAGARQTATKLAFKAPAELAMRSTAVWLLRGWSRTFERNRLVVQVGLVTPLVVASAACGYGVVSLVVFFIGFWPFPYRARWTAEGLEVSWLLVRECLRFADIRSASLHGNVRYLLLFRHELVLQLELTEGRRAALVATPRAVRALYSEITAALARSPLRGA
jgi:hypothetical protein